jgi:serine O-acetyltransferase
MSWWSDYRLDVKKYQGLTGGSALKQILTEQGLWVLLVYRIEAAVYRSVLHGIIKRPLQLLLIIGHKLIEVSTGVNLPCTARVGPGLHLPHCGYRVVNGGAEIGADCCLLQGVTIGVSGRGEHRGVPKIGNRVYIGANATVVGKIVVGDDSIIAANSLVNRDVPPHCTVLGVPAKVVSNHGSEDYIPVLTASKAPQPVYVDEAQEPVLCK